MNGKKARLLRNIIREEMGDMPEVLYTQTNVHTRDFPTGHTNLDGTPHMIPLQLSTIELVGCQRKAYQKAKVAHRLYHTQD